MEVTARQMEIDGGLLQVTMAEQNLNRPEVRAILEQVRSEAMPKCVRVNVSAQACSFRSRPAGQPHDFGLDGRLAGVPAIAGEQPHFGSASQAAPVMPQLFQEFRAEHDVSILAAFSALDMHHHTLFIDVADLQAREFCTAKSSGVKRHQDHAIERKQTRSDAPLAPD